MEFGVGVPVTTKADPKIIWTSGEATVWHASLAEYDEEDLAGLLSSDELVRASTYGTAELRRRFVVRRGLLRRLLGEATGQEPESFAFEVGIGGKPAILGGPFFNVSSSGEQALFGVSPRGPIGVDLERIDPEFDFGPLLADHFTADERSWLDAFPAEQRAHQFFQIWTRKEAFAKAIGLGLAEPLSSYPVSTGSTRFDMYGTLIEVLDLPAPGGFAASVALE
ncbi:MAG: 4'-phosphopantetheinyl transferase family protein [Fimbriimonadales bacterium]